MVTHSQKKRREDTSTRAYSSPFDKVEFMVSRVRMVLPARVNVDVRKRQCILWVSSEEK